MILATPKYLHYSIPILIWIPNVSFNLTNSHFLTENFSKVIVSVSMEETLNSKEHSYEMKEPKTFQAPIWSF